MSTAGNAGPQGEVSDVVGSILDVTCRILLWVGLLACGLSLALLIFYIAAFEGGNPQQIQAAQGFIEIAQKALTLGSIAMLVGLAYLVWGADWLGIASAAYAAALYFAPLYVPAIMGGSPNQVAASSLAAMQAAGTGAGIVAIGTLLIDIVIRVRDRAVRGVKVDQLQYGKGIKEEADRKNVFLGKCWQLPYCRKFVRDRCPIYHARRTCWREKTGCMCDEEVIKGAMENRTIPKDALAAARYIPQNNKLTLGQKRERCRQCVIYNEHQRHKYRALLPLVVAGFGIFYYLGRTSLLDSTRGAINSINDVIASATLGQAGGDAVQVPPSVQELLLVCIVVVVFAYALKLLEFMVFKLKV